MWEIRTTDIFDEWFDGLNDVARENVIAAMMVLRELGPTLPRPYADTVKGSEHKNMKELRVQSRGNPIRAFFAFDPHRTGVLLCAGEKAGNNKRFYKELIPVADREFKAHLERLRQR
ncbi:MAG: type II toxin-antitoxin system RelE/ParE family toxin [Pseudomonadota bacterium]